MSDRTLQLAKLINAFNYDSSNAPTQLMAGYDNITVAARIPNNMDGRDGNLWFYTTSNWLYVKASGQWYRAVVEHDLVQYDIIIGHPYPTGVSFDSGNQAINITDENLFVTVGIITYNGTVLSEGENYTIGGGGNQIVFHDLGIEDSDRITVTGNVEATSGADTEFNTYTVEFDTDTRILKIRGSRGDTDTALIPGGGGSGPDTNTTYNFSFDTDSRLFFARPSMGDSESVLIPGGATPSGSDSDTTYNIEFDSDTRVLYLRPSKGDSESVVIPRTHIPAGLDSDTTYGLAWNDGTRTLTLTPSKGAATNLHITDSDTQYTFTFSENERALTVDPSRGGAAYNLLILDSDTTYSASFDSDTRVLYLRPSRGDSEAIVIPHTHIPAGLDSDTTYSFAFQNSNRTLYVRPNKGDSEAIVIPSGSGGSSVDSDTTYNFAFDTDDRRLYIRPSKGDSESVLIPGGGTGGGNVRSDWAENDSDATDYVLNRTNVTVPIGTLGQREVFEIDFSPITGRTEALPPDTEQFLFTPTPGFSPSGPVNDSEVGEATFAHPAGSLISGGTSGILWRSINVQRGDYVRFENSDAVYLVLRERSFSGYDANEGLMHPNRLVNNIVDSERLFRVNPATTYEFTIVDSELTTTFADGTPGYFTEDQITLDSDNFDSDAGVYTVVATPVYSIDFLTGGTNGAYFPTNGSWINEPSGGTVHGPIWRRADGARWIIGQAFPFRYIIASNMPPYDTDAVQVIGYTPGGSRRVVATAGDTDVSPFNVHNWEYPYSASGFTYARPTDPRPGVTFTGRPAIRGVYIADTDHNGTQNANALGNFIVDLVNSNADSDVRSDWTFDTDRQTINTHDASASRYMLTLSNRGAGSNAIIDVASAAHADRISLSWYMDSDASGTPLQTQQLILGSNQSVLQIVRDIRNRLIADFARFTDRRIDTDTLEIRGTDLAPRGLTVTYTSGRSDTDSERIMTTVRNTQQGIVPDLTYQQEALQSITFDSNDNPTSMTLTPTVGHPRVIDIGRPLVASVSSNGFLFNNDGFLTAQWINGDCILRHNLGTTNYVVSVTLRFDNTLTPFLPLVVAKAADFTTVRTQNLTQNHIPHAFDIVIHRT